MKKSLLPLVLFMLALSAFAQKGKTSKNPNVIPNEIRIPLTSEMWEFPAGKVEFMEYKSAPAMKLLTGAGQVVLKNQQFSDGIIEFDLEPINPYFTSFYFRRKDAQESECFYLRVGRANNPVAMDAVQYAPIIKGVNLWDLLGSYQGPAMIKNKDFNHIKLVISGKQLAAYVNSSEKPTLEIPNIEGNNAEGGLAFEGEAIISNLVVRPKEVEGLQAKEGLDPTYNDSRYIREWFVGQPFTLPVGKEVNMSDLPKNEVTWEKIKTERLGLVNLTRNFGKSESRRAVWLKVKLKTEAARTLTLDFGFSDEVWAFLNGRMAFTDKNLYGHPIMKNPEGRCSVENTSFKLPLKSGSNELLIAVANDFYGWAIIARLETMEGITIEE